MEGGRGKKTDRERYSTVYGQDSPRKEGKKINKEQKQEAREHIHYVNILHAF